MKLVPLLLVVVANEIQQLRADLVEDVSSGMRSVVLVADLKEVVEVRALLDLRERNDRGGLEEGEELDEDEGLFLEFEDR